MKKLYLISRTGGHDYDEFDSAVVCAKSEGDARNTHPSGNNERFESAYGGWVAPEAVVVTLLGVASRKTALGVVCASFNAG